MKSIPRSLQSEILDRAALKSLGSAYDTRFLFRNVFDQDGVTFNRIN